MSHLLFPPFGVLHVEKCRQVRSAAGWELMTLSTWGTTSTACKAQPGELWNHIVQFILAGCSTGRLGSLWDSLQPLTFGSSAKHCFFHINPFTLHSCTELPWSSCSFSTYELCRWCSSSCLFPKCHGYSLPGTVEQLLNLWHNEVVNKHHRQTSWIFTSE